VLNAVVRLNRNVSRSSRRFMLDVECEFFVETFDLCPKTHGLIVYNFMFEFDCTVTSVHYHEHTVEYLFNVI
jgi:hypothetical protein